MRGLKKRTIAHGIFCLLLTALLISSAWPMVDPAPAKASVSLGHRLTNVNDVRFTVSWLTTGAEKGYVEYGSTPALGSKAYDDRGQETQNDTHHVTVFGTLKPNSQYYYDIVSGSSRDDNDGKHYTVTTGPTLEIPNPDDIVGQVFLDATKTTPANGAIVYITVVAGGTSSQELSALVEPSGWWGLDIGSTRTANYQSYFSYTRNDEASMVANGAGNSRDSKSCSIAVARVGVPAMVLTSSPVTPETPAVLSALPANGAKDIDTGVNITATFNQDMNPSTINTNSFTVSGNGTKLAGVVTYNESTRAATFDPKADLAYNTTYTATITTQAQSKAGYNLAQSYTWSFKTIAAPPGKESTPKPTPTPTPTPTPASKATPTPTPTETSDVISSKGAFLKAVNVQSEDGRVNLTIDKGTTGLIKGKPISGVSITKVKPEGVPPLSKSYSIIGSVYDFGPSQATFSMPISLIISYNPGDIPKGVSEGNLVIAFWDSSEWVVLEGSIVDPAAHTISVPISHFTNFAVLAYTRPAAFTVSGLTISPTEVVTGQEATVSLIFTNAGDLEATHKVILRIDGAVAATKETTLAAGASMEVTFTVSRDTAGTHTVSVEGLSGTLSVTAAPSKPLSWWVWLLIGIAVVIIGVAGSMVRWRRLLGD